MDENPYRAPQTKTKGFNPRPRSRAQYWIALMLVPFGAFCWYWGQSIILSGGGGISGEIGELIWMGGPIISVIGVIWFSVVRKRRK